MSEFQLTLVDYDPFDEASEPTVSNSAYSIVDYDPFAEEAEAEETEAEEDGWGDVVGKAFENTPDLFKRSIGGAMEWIGENSPGRRLGAQLRAYDDYVKLPSEEQTIGRAHAEVNKQVKKDEIATTGREMYREATDSIAANQPNVPDESAKFYAGQILQSMVQMGPSVAAGLITRNPNLSMSLMGSQVYSDQYAEARAHGRNEAEAQQDALFYAATEAVSERIPLGILTKEGGKLLTRTLKAAGAEGAQEVVNEALGMGYQVGILNDEMTLAEAMRRLKDAGIIGVGVGGGLGIVTQPFAPEEIPSVDDDVGEPVAPGELNGPVQRKSPLILPPTMKPAPFLPTW
ncbi:MAG: hypothetical protein GY832_05105 [Chloroflexi bacterium]|nr:hypothetical protein [Chloroflexota bacterium]